MCVFSWDLGIFVVFGGLGFRRILPGVGGLLVSAFRSFGIGIWMHVRQSRALLEEPDAPKGQLANLWLNIEGP